jgi:hypothetical protein
VALLEACFLDLCNRHGEMDFRSASLPFEYTDYYEEEMGRPLYRLFVSFQRLIRSEDLREIKLHAGELEAKYCTSEGKRRLNLDPGYVTGPAFILATSKNYAHRIHLGNGVFAQQELLFEKKRVRTLDWTYPDYRAVEYQDVLQRIRRTYLQQLREPGSK